MKTRIYDNIPGDFGVSKTSLPGFSDVEIESRVQFINQVKKFIRHSLTFATGSNAFPVIGEWGQGKTDSYFRFIEPYVKSEGHHALFISTSTLSRVYKNKNAQKVANKTNLISLNFLANLFEGIRSESRSEFSKRIPSIEEYPEPDTYMRDILGSFTENNNKKIFIFIDEFEEILNQEENILRDIISGIKETNNGNYQLIDVNGEFKGSIQFFMAVTPDALYKLRTLEGIEEIFGGFLRRLNAIELKGINRKEGILYLKKMLEDSYNNNIPTNPYPIESYGLFNTLFRISQRNIGNLHKLFTNLFNFLENNGELEVLNYQNLIEFLKRNKVFVYGAQSDCIEEENYNRIIGYLKEHSNEELGNVSAELFKLFLADYRPLNLKFLSKKLNKDENFILRTITTINETISDEEKIKRPILILSKLSSDKTIEDIKKVFESDIEHNEASDKYEIVLGQKTPYREFLDDFIDRITFLNLNSANTLSSEIYLPIETKYTKMFFRGEISSNLAEELSTKFKKLVNENEIEYIANELVLDKIYPTPIPRDLNFIRNKEKRMEIWRDVLKNLPEYYEEKILDTFIDTLIHSGIYSINKQKIEIHNDYQIVKIFDIKSKTEIKVLLYIVNGDVKPDDVNYVNSIISDDISLNLAIILFNNDFPDKSRALIQNNQIIGIYLNSSVAKTLICTEIAQDKYERCPFEIKDGDKQDRKIDCNILKSVSRKIVQKDFSFDEKIDEWLNSQIKEGLVIEQIETDNTFKKLADCLKLYINYESTPSTAEEIFNINEENLLSFKKYKKYMSGLIGSDFESHSIIKELSTDLYYNELLDKKDSKFFVKKHPVEKRLEQLFENEKKISNNDLEKAFIIRGKQGNVLEDLFLEILVYRGIVTKGNKVKGKIDYTLVNSDIELKKLKKKYNRFKEFVESSGPSSHIFVAKDRDCKIMFLDDFYNFITNLFKSIETLPYSNKKEELFKKIYMTDKLIDYFNKTYTNDIQSAFRAEKRYQEDIEKEKLSFDKDFEEIVQNSLKWLKIELKEGKNSIQEYKKLKIHYNEFNEFYEKETDKDELLFMKKVLPKDEKCKFKFNIKPPENAYFFNLRVYRLNNLLDDYMNEASSISKQLKRNKSHFETINYDISSLKEQYDILNVEDKKRISYQLYKDISFSDLKNQEPQFINNIKLSVLDSRSKDEMDKIRKNYREKQKNITLVEDVLEKETELLDAIDSYKNELNDLKKVFDYDWLKKHVESFEYHLSRIETEYKTFDLLKLKKKHITFNIEKWKKTIDQHYKNEITDVWKYFILDIKKDINKIEKSIKTVKNIHKNSEKDFDKRDENQIDAIIKKLEIIKKLNSYPLKDDYSAAQIKDSVAKMQNRWREILRKYLDEHEENLLDVIQELSTKSRWIDLEHIYEKALEKDIDKNTVDVACQNLLNKKYLQQGFSII